MSFSQSFASVKARSAARYRRIAGWTAERLEALEPSRATTRWIRRTSLFGVLAFGAWIGAAGLSLPYGMIADALAGMVIALLVFGSVWLSVVLGVKLVTLLRRHWSLAGLAATLAMAVLTGMFLPATLSIPVGLALGLALILLGVGIALLVRRPARPTAAVSALVPALAVLAFFGGWLAFGKMGEDPVLELVSVPDHDGTAFAGLLQPGSYQVGFLTYGSGADKRRPEYAGEVAWTSEPVDAHDMLGRPSGWQISLRERWWGFGLDALPLNGRVWYPKDAEGELPLVLVVHGNHDMMHYSDPGYAWLGEHLASRGHVVVSVDENFLNGGLFGNLTRENATRGWLLLKHLEAWRGWRRAPEHALHRRVDLDRVVLIGHSRGGEAAALAGAFNRLDRHPENARVEFDFGFGIQGIAAIAPVDGQFWASNKPTPLEDVSYFVIHGGYDADMYYFAGDRQLARARPDSSRGRFSASLYLHHANHGQFNTVWGDSDWGGAGRPLLNRAALLRGEDQRRAGLLYMTGFVETALARPSTVPAYFCDPAAAGRLLPETLYVARCDDGRRTLLADFEQDLALSRGTLPGVSLYGRDLAIWSERDVGFRGNTDRLQTGVFLGWHAADNAATAQPVWSLELDETARARLPLSNRSVLWLDMAQADQSPPDETEDGEEIADEDDDEPTENETDNGLRDPIRLVIELEDVHGNRASRPLSDFTDLPPPLPVRQTRLKILDQRFHSPTEPVLKSVAVPLRAFADAGISPEALRAIHLRFNNAAEGVLIIERIAIE